ncbi:ZIP family metal transporter [Candidatus Shapirobacteria bacterium CG_4_9_14_0_2_um_filter_39_11]|uniref:ZIP family metal transporter n=1 Tax=Candidatus Shapirobacteria bacterium CG_4_9_14_0_2_um_filter_39_11 TaxID=1974478 RepID=A0A2M8ET39_9BACT|nr:MAG: ZIP family metal transporter [Candidatus Shapirobacteria bacterium CG_4_9_14_0_2_um_filter_39_11]
MDPRMYSLISVIFVSLLSFVGVLFIAIKEEKLKKILLFLVSFAAGGLLGDSFIHLLPEAVEEDGFSLSVSLAVLVGLLLFFVLEKFICWRHCHIPTSKSHPHPVVFMNLIGDGFHNFIDGAVISASFLTTIPLGIATTLAVVLHEIPQEIGDFGVLLHGGLSKNKALIFNFASALAAVGGAILVLILGERIVGVSQLLIPFTAGGFIYIAGSDLIPELHKETNLAKSLIQMVGLILGIGIMLILLFI